jgi:class 3 adenylate cyclase
MELLGLHDKVVRDALAAEYGREVKHTGDGIMASFMSPAAAVRAAARIQTELERHHSEHPDRPLKVRIGAAAGEPIEHHHDLFGSTVQLAARLCSHAEPEQILVSNVVVGLYLGKSMRFQDLGEVALKGFENPVRVHAASWPVEEA